MSSDWVVVHWLDIVGLEHPWVSAEEASELRPAAMTTVGRLLVEEPGYIVIASTIESDGDLQFGNVNCIPRGVIGSIQELGVRHELTPGG